MSNRRAQLLGSTSYTAPEFAHEASSFTYKPAETMRAAVEPSAMAPLGTNEIGLILSPLIEITSSDGFRSTGTALDEGLIRAALLYWDRIDYPTNNFVFMQDSQVDELERLGVLQKTHVKLEGQIQGGKGILFAQDAAFRHLESTQPGRWSLGSTITGLTFPDIAPNVERGLLVEIAGALPTPTITTRIDSILEFRHKRRPEPLGYRSEVAKVYADVLSNPDRALAKSIAVDRLDAAVQATRSAAAEFGLPVTVGNLGAKFDGSTLAVGIAGSIAAASHGGGLLGSVTSGAIAAAGKVILSAGLTVGLKSRTRSKSPFQYVIDVNRELRSPLVLD